MLSKTIKGKLQNQSSSRKLQQLKPIMVITPKYQEARPQFHSPCTPVNSKFSPRKANNENSQSTMHLKSRLRPLNLLGLLAREKSIIFQRPASLGEIVEDKTISKLRGTKTATQSLSSRNIHVNLFEFSGNQHEILLEDRDEDISLFENTVLGNITGNFCQQEIEYFG